MLEPRGSSFVVPGVVLLALTLAGATSEAKVIHVPHGPGTPLQDAVDAASPGDVLKLEGGIFGESVVIDKPLRLKGTTKNPAIISPGCGSSTSVVIASDGVTIDNVAINSGLIFAIDMFGRSDVTLSRVSMMSQCAGASAGAIIAQSSNVKIIRCEAVGFADAGFYIEGIAADAGVSVKKGTAQLNGVGVLLENSSPGLRIRGLRALNNDVTGILLRNTDGALVARNEVADNATGIALDANSAENRIKGNRLSGNGTDGDDQGTSNCWRGNRNPTGAPLTGMIPTNGCP